MGIHRWLRPHLNATVKKIRGDSQFLERRDSAA